MDGVAGSRRERVVDAIIIMYYFLHYIPNSDRRSGLAECIANQAVEAIIRAGF